MFPDVLDNRQQTENAAENKNASLFGTRCSLCEIQMSTNLSRTQSSGSRERMMTMDWQSLDPQMLCQLCWKSFGGSAIAGRRPPKSEPPFCSVPFSLTNSEPPFFRSEQVGTTIFFFRSCHCKLRIVDGFQGTASRCQV